VLAWLKEQGSGQHSCPVAFEYEGCRFAGRLMACSLPEEAAERARTKERKKAAKQQRQLKEETLYLCGWLVLFTSLTAHEWSDEQVLALYRARGPRRTGHQTHETTAQARSAAWPDCQHQ
jgi:hypothetical protein